MNNSGWRVLVSNDAVSKRRTLQAIITAINQDRIWEWDDWEISNKGPDRKNAGVFIHWDEEMRLKDLLDEYGFFFC